MQVKVLESKRFRILAVMDGDECPTETFLLEGDPNTKIWRMGMVRILEHVADQGLSNLPHEWCHEADKELGIYEFRKGKLRLFFFKGSGNDIAVCTSGVRKQAQKADKGSVEWASKRKSEYLAAVIAETLEVVEDDVE